MEEVIMEEDPLAIPDIGPDPPKPTIQKTTISISSKIISTRKRPARDKSATQSPKVAYTETKQDQSLTDMTLFHTSQGLLKDAMLLANKLNTSILVGPNYACSLCNDNFFSGLKLKFHYLIVHKVQHCVTCDLLVESDEQLAAHNKNVHDGKGCEICQEKFEEDRLVHYKSKHDAVICPYCNVILHPSALFNNHLTEKHVLTKSFLELGKPDEILELIGNKGVTYFCKMCEKRRSKEIFGHFAYHHKLNTYYLARVFPELSVDTKFGNINEAEELKCQMEPDENRKWCSVCFGSFSKYASRPLHKVYCESRVYCIHCKKTFVSTNELQIHTDRKHPSFPCQFNCEETFATVETLEMHHNDLHKQSKCLYCDAFEENMEAHVAEFHRVESPDWGIHLIKEEDSKTICSLCNVELKNEVNTPNKLVMHYKLFHKMTLHRITESIGRSRNATVKHVQVKTNELDFQSDFNPKFVKCLFDYKTIKEFNNVINCVCCDIKIDSHLNLIAHLFDTHDFLMPASILDCDTCTWEDKKCKLLNHLEHYVENDWKTYECQKCHYAMSLEDAREHILEKHCDELDFFNREDCGVRCRFCTESFWKDLELEQHELAEHLVHHKNEFYQCYSCNHTFNSIKSLVAHDTHVKTDCQSYSEFVYQCSVCVTVFPDIEGVRKHFKQYHSKLSVYVCGFEGCKKTFVAKKLVRAHFKACQSKSGAINSFDCEICGQNFITKKSFLLHSKNSHSKGFKCVICGDKFQSAEHRKHHYNTHHPGELMYECAECQRTFLSKSALHLHMNLHTEFTVECKYCGKKFYRRDSYKEHLLIHIGPKHQCIYCPKVFTQKSNLRRHIRLHTGEKPYQCPHCPKTFSDKGACNSHVSVHTRSHECYCEVCGKKFSKPQKLKYHMKKHTGVGLFKCDICDHGFVSQYDLRKHTQTHTNTSTQIICECGKGFSSEKYLRSHIKVVHEKNKSKICKSKRLKAIGKCFKCKLCGKFYLYRNAANKHLKNSHSLHPQQYKDNIEKVDAGELDQVYLNGSSEGDGETSERTDNTQSESSDDAMENGDEVEDPQENIEEVEVKSNATMDGIEDSKKIEDMEATKLTSDNKNANRLEAVEASKENSEEVVKSIEGDSLEMKCIEEVAIRLNDGMISNIKVEVNCDDPIQNVGEVMVGLEEVKMEMPVASARSRSRKVSKPSKYVDVMVKEEVGDFDDEYE